jgi:hypothetical protein
VSPPRIAQAEGPAYLPKSENVSYGKLLTDLDHYVLWRILYPAHGFHAEDLLGQEFRGASDGVIQTSRPLKHRTPPVFPTPASSFRRDFWNDRVFTARGILGGAGDKNITQAMVSM